LNIPAPFHIDLESFHINGVIRDMVFLEGYSHPTLLLLYEVNDTLPLPGRTANEGSCNAIAISFGLNLPSKAKHQTSNSKSYATKEQRAWMVFTAKDLPFDAARLHPCPLGSCLVFCENSVMIIDQDQLGNAAVNSFAPHLKSIEGVGVGESHMSSGLLPDSNPPPGSVSAIFQSALQKYISASYSAAKNELLDAESVNEAAQSEEVDESVCEVLSSAPCCFLSPNVAILSTNRLARFKKKKCWGINAFFLFIVFCF
jgi:hypothetical protein